MNARQAKKPEDAMHIYPNYGPDHVFTRDADGVCRCWCRPREEDDGVGGLMIIHQEPPS